MLIAQKEAGLNGSASSSSFLQEQQLMHLSQLQNLYSQQAEGGQPKGLPGVVTAPGLAYPAHSPTQQDHVQALAAAASRASPRPIGIPGSEKEPLSLDPNSLGSGGLDGLSILTPMVNAVAAAAANSSSGPQMQGNSEQAEFKTHFFPPTPSENAK